MKIEDWVQENFFIIGGVALGIAVIEVSWQIKTFL